MIQLGPDRGFATEHLRRYARALLILSFGLSFCFCAMPAFAADSDGQLIDGWQMGIQLLGGLAIFLFGMDQMSGSLKKVAGSRMKDILGSLSNNRIMGLGTGAFVTAVIQSSSVTTVLLVGFVTTGLMSFSQAIGVILGANIGTTITAQIVAFKITEFALVLVGGGFFVIFTATNDKWKYYGTLVMGLGLIFFGMGIMSTAMKPLRDFEPFIALMGSVSNPLIGILVAAAFTGLVQSSSATMGVVIALALQGLITLEAGIALALGANIGTCVTAGLAAIGKPREAKRVAFAHIAFNTLGVLLFVGLVGPLADFVRNISPVEEGVTGLAKLAAETPRQVANAHTFFNVANALIFLPLAGLFARICEWVVPDKPLILKAVIEPKYLDEELLSTPAFALERARLEIARMGERVGEMLEKILPAALTGSAVTLEAIADMDTDVDILHGHIVHYLGQISANDLSPEEGDQLMTLFTMVKEMEEIGDTIETDMVMLGLRRIEENISVSEPTMERIREYHEQVVRAFQLTLKVIREMDIEAIKEVRAMKQTLAQFAEETAHHEVMRLLAKEPNRLNTYRRETETIDYLTRIFRHCRRIARTTQAALPALATS